MMKIMVKIGGLILCSCYQDSCMTKKMKIYLMFILDLRLYVVFVLARFLNDEEMVINLMFILNWRLNIVLVLARLFTMMGKWRSILFLSIVSVLMAASEASSSTIGPIYAPDDSTLPVPWKGLIDGSTGVLYYWNLQTNVTQYEKPTSVSPPLPPGPPPLTPNMNPIPAARASQPDNVQTPQDLQALQTQLPHGQLHWSHFDPSVQHGQQMPSYLGQMPIQQGQPGLPQSMQQGHQPPYQHMPHHQPGQMYPGSPIGTQHAFRFSHQHEQYPTHQQNMSLQGPRISYEQPQHLNQGQQLPHNQEPEMELGQRDDSEFHQAYQPDIDVGMDVDMIMDMDVDVDENNGFNIHNQHDDFFKSAIVFLPRDRKNDFLPVRNQLGTGCCTSFAMVTIVTAAAREKYRTLLKLSERQICYLLGEGISLDYAADYIQLHGLMKEESCPWTGNCLAVLPFLELPCPIYKSIFGKVLEHGCEKILLFQPIATVLYFTESAVSWCENGYKGIFKYPEHERNEILYKLSIEAEDLPGGHAVVIVGYGIERAQRFYFVQDSIGTSINWGYRKLDPNVIFCGVYVKDVVEEMIESCDSLVPVRKF